MESWARNKDKQKDLKEAAREDRIKQLKEKRWDKLMEHRLNAHIKDHAYKKCNMDLEVEKPKEEEDNIGHLDLNQYRKRKKWKSKKRCWNCKSPNHLRDHCPRIRCFHCHRLGHVKANCYMHRINKILSELERQQRRKKKQKQQKQKEREEEINIIRTRANQSTFINTEGKWRLKWNELEIGTFLDPGSPRPLEDIKGKNFKWQHVQVELKLPTPIKKLHLEDGF